jgi:hypothetical protein
MKKETLYKFVLGISLVGYVWVAWNAGAVHDPHSAQTVCLVKSITGIPCPSCGTTRSVTTLLEGNIADSITINPFGVAAVSMLIVFPVWVVIDHFRKRDSFFRWYTSTERKLSGNKWIIVASVIVVTANWWWNITKSL